MRTPAGLRLEYLSRAAFSEVASDEVLGVAAFGGASLTETEVPVARVAVPLLVPDDRCLEVWCCGPAVTGERQRVQLRRTHELLFGAISLSESAVIAEAPRAAVAGASAHELRASRGARPSALHAATTEVYREICATLKAERYPHLLRIWNYLPDINLESHGTERYRQFNTARQQALREGGRAIAGGVPASCALGAASGSPLTVYFLAARTAPGFIENPRQTSAYHYPRRYGTHPPAFSRATLLAQSAGVTLFISGTASIVGHRSLHPGDPASQTRETLANIEALLEAARRACGAPFTHADLAFKVYLRRGEDLSVVRAELAAALGAKAQVLYLGADICRQDLLVEIEATAMQPRSA